MKTTLPPFRSPLRGRALLLACSLTVASAQAQSQALIEQARLRSALLDVRPELQEKTEDELDEIEGEAIETPGDLDLGVQLIMKPKERVRPLRLFATFHEYYTDNVGLANNNLQSDTYHFVEIGARYENKLTESLSLEATVRQALFRYDEFTGLDFESLNAGVGLGYRLPQRPDITVFARYNCERLTNDDLSNEFFLNQTLSIGVQKSWVSQGKILFYTGYASSFGFADPSAAERDEHSLYGGAHWQLTEHLEADLYYRLALFDFQSGQRDLNHMIVPSLTYRFSPWCELNASLSFVMNRSNRSRLDYDALTAGGGLGLRVQF